jgi:hypothetical protein
MRSNLSCDARAGRGIRRAVRPRIRRLPSEAADPEEQRGLVRSDDRREPGLLYVSYWDAGTVNLNIATPSNPVEVGTTTIAR